MINDLSNEGAVGAYEWEDRDLVDLKPAGGFFNGKPAAKWAVFEKGAGASPEPGNLAHGSVRLDDASAAGEISFGGHKSITFPAIGTPAQASTDLGHLQGTGTQDETYHIVVLRPDKTVLDTCSVFVAVSGPGTATSIVQALNGDSAWAGGHSLVDASVKGSGSDEYVTVSLKASVAEGEASNDHWIAQPQGDGQLWGWDDQAERGNLFKGGSGGGVRTAQDIADAILAAATDPDDTYLSKAEVSGGRIEFTANEAGVEDAIAVTGSMFSDSQGMSL